MKSLPERQKERALRMLAAQKGEDMSQVLNDKALLEAKAAAQARLEDAEPATFVPPQFAVGPVKAKDLNIPAGKTVTDKDGNEVDGDPAGKKPSESTAKISAKTMSDADKVGKAAENNASVGWSANAAAAGAGGGAKK